MISLILILTTKNSLWLLNYLFYIGLACFIAGGFLLIIYKGIFNRMFRSFKRFYQNTSKVEEYVSSETPSTPTQQSNFKKGYAFIKWILECGIVLILVTIISALFFHS